VSRIRGTLWRVTASSVGAGRPAAAGPRSCYRRARRCRTAARRLR
jgi:hypothetical protein